MQVAVAEGLDGAGAPVHFRTEIDEVALRPGTGGVFLIEVNGELVWDRVWDGGLPDVKIRKRLIRNRASLNRDLDHIDRD